MPGPYRRVLALGLIVGVAYFAGTLYWITDVLVAYGGLNRPVAMILNAMLIAFLALFPAVGFLGLAAVLLRLGHRAFLLAPAFWVTVELAREHFFGGFPWVLLGYSQVTVLPVAQLASVFGVYGVSGLVALVSAALVYPLVSPDRAPYRPLIAALGIVVLVVGWGLWRIRDAHLTRAGQPIAVGLVQGNIPQEQKWDPAFRTMIVSRYLTMSREVAEAGARLIIWPESSTPFQFEEDLAGAEAVRRLAMETGAYLLIGSDQLERGAETRVFNAAFLVRPGGQTAEIYRKIHLVPFGEYIPARQILFFAAPLVETVSDFSAGAVPVTLRIGNHLASTAICYEVVYPSLIRRFVVAGSELLTTITNDAWYGRSSAPYQHFEQASMRAIEQGRYLARSANTGISGIVDPYGRVIVRSSVFTAEALVREVRFLKGRTIYGRIGDLFAYLCAALSLAAVGAVLSGRRRKG